MAQIGNNPKVAIEEDLVRHIVLSCIRSYVKQFKTKYGSLVICCDNKENWRRDVFPFYKRHRKKDREKSGFDWPQIFEILNRVKDELKDFSPYKVVEVSKAEADDIIAVLTKTFYEQEPILILSSDKDFVQLQKYKNVKQYSPHLKRFISADDPNMFIKEHILRGDRGDGIPNFLSEDNTFVSGGRQKAINTKKLNEWLKQDPSEFCANEQQKRGFERNKKLVDFDQIPSVIIENVTKEFDRVEPKPKTKFLTYMNTKKMRFLVKDIGDF